MKNLFCCIVAHIALSTSAYAQYPFERMPGVRYKEYKGWKMVMDRFAMDRGEMSFDKTIPDFWGTESLRLRLTSIDSPNMSYISCYKGKKLLGKVSEKTSFFTGNLEGTIYVGDINGDSLADIKLLCPYNGCGLAAMYVQVIYLFQQPGGKFTKVSYMDMMDGNRMERDLDGDGNNEIITMSVQQYKAHNYWTFNAYNYANGKLVNVNTKVNYPLMVQYLNRQNYTPADLPEQVLQKHTANQPEELDVHSIH